MFGNVPKIGLEPTHLAAPEPKSGVSTNFTTWAKHMTISFSTVLRQSVFHLRVQLKVRG